MKPRPTTDADRAYWVDYNPVGTVIGGPPDEPDCLPCPALITTDEKGRTIVRVPFELDEIEVMHLARGGTLWLSTWGGLPIHMIEVQEPTQQGARDVH